MEEHLRDTSTHQSRTACTECQRRKQKCNREWPCNHCQKRKVADKCRFNNTPQEKAPQEIKKKPSVVFKAPAEIKQEPDVVSTVLPEPAPQISIKKRSRSARDDYAEDTDSDGSEGEDFGLADLGYMTTQQFASLGLEVTKDHPAPRQYWAKPSACYQLERALNVLPGRAHMDALVQNFFDNVNFHYFIIYPPVFLQEYQEWWDKRTHNRSISLQWTCLLLMVCACAAQHIPVDMQDKLELEMGEKAEKISADYHKTARELSGVVPVGYYHMYNVQSLLHSTYWYKAEARFLECWHVLGSAAREAQELGFHRKEAAEHLPEFDREMRRRVWCLVDTWDWQISSGLFRPSIIDRRDITVDLPTLTLEEYSPSPLMHLKLQSELIRRLAKRFAAPRNINTPSEAQEYKAIIDRWMLDFPPAYALTNPDTSQDQIHSWIPFHRHYIHTMGYMMLLNPLRSYVSAVVTEDTPPELLAIRAMGVDYSLRLIDVLQDWTDFVSHRDGRFHFIIFSLFDTAAVLSAAIINDKAGTVPSRNQIYITIDLAVALLKRLMALSMTAKMSYNILSRIVRKVPRPDGYTIEANHRRFKAVARNHESMAPVQAQHFVYVSEQPQMLVAPPGSNLPQIPRGDILASSHAPLQSHGRAGVGAHATYTAPITADDQLYSRPYMIETTPDHFGVVDGMTAVMTPQSDYAGMHDLSYSTASESAPPSVDGNGGSPNSSIDSIHANDLAHHDAFDELLPHEADLEGHHDQELGFQTITDAELGALATTWNWQSLNLDFISSEVAAATAAAEAQQPPV